jgi:hypothetical protein
MIYFILNYLKSKRERNLRKWIVKNAPTVDYRMFYRTYESLMKPQKRGERRLRKWLFKRGIVNTIDEAYTFITGHLQ